MYADVKNWRNVTRRTLPYDGITAIVQGCFITLDGATGEAVLFGADWDGRQRYGFVFKGTEQNVVQVVDALDVVLGPSDAIIETDNCTAAVLAADIDVPVTLHWDGTVCQLDVCTVPATDPCVGHILAIDAGNGRVTVTLDGVRFVS
jgi:hypothetical protein